MHLATAGHGREAGANRYRRHRPEQTLLYQIVERHYPAFSDHLAEAGKDLPGVWAESRAPPDRPVGLLH